MAWFCKDCGETSSDYAVENTPVAELNMKTMKWILLLDPCCVQCRSANITPAIAWEEFVVKETV